MTVVVSGGPDARVRLHSGENGVITPPRKPGSDGKLRFERLPAGEYELWKVGPDGKTERLKITLPGQQVVDF